MAEQGKEEIWPVFFTARQAIVTSSEQVIGYELLFRSGFEEHFHHSDPDHASLNVIDASILHGVGDIANGRAAFINCTRDTLLECYLDLLPPTQVVAELLESIEPDREVEQQCNRLKRRGVRIALDDFMPNDRRSRLLSLADYVKVDLSQVTRSEARSIAGELMKTGCSLVAEHVETRADFEFAQSAGFTLFQGYFFHKPDLIQVRGLRATHISYSRLLHEISKPVMNWDQVEDIVKSDAALCFRLLRYVNSAILEVGQHIGSIRQGLVLMGEERFRDWCRLIAAPGVADAEPTDLLVAALTRGKFLELIGPAISDSQVDFFLLGLMSVMDRVLEIPAEEVIEKLPLRRELNEALCGRGANDLRAALELADAIEAGNWIEISKRCDRHGLNELAAAQAFWQASVWSNNITKAA